jgi:hypothetical protein
MKKISDEISKSLSNNGVLLLSFSGLLKDEDFIPCTESYRNYLFKRALFDTDGDFVICLDETKVDHRFIISDDHYKIFSIPEWNEIFSSKSICFVITSEVVTDSNKFEEFLESRGFQ